MQGFPAMVHQLIHNLEKLNCQRIIKLEGYIFGPLFDLASLSTLTKAPLELAGPIISSFIKNTGVKKLGKYTIMWTQKFI